METARFVLTPFYECMDSIIPLTQMRITNSIPDVKPGRYIGSQMIEFSLQLDHSFLLSESKKHKSSKFDIRAIIRFCNIENVNKIDDQFALKDCFPLHLKLNLNNTGVTLPQFLPNDRSGKDGRRFPRPVDLSEGLLDNPLVINKFLMQWVQDDCKKETYYFAVYLVRRRTCEELTYILLKKQLSPLKNTLNFILEQSNNLNNFQDDDLMLVNTTINTSLICPVSRVRMTTPVRGQHCTHLQCFDCITYLIMNFNKPTWQCPVCDKKTFFCYLEVDSLILGILNDSRSNSISSVVFNKNGQWKPDKKIPGITSDDESYYDITSYFNVNDSTNNTYQMIPEHFTETNADKYLQQILQSTNRVSQINRFRQPHTMNNLFPVLPNATVPNRMPSINPLLTEAHVRAAFNAGSNPSSHPLYPTTGAFQENLRHISAVTSSMNINPNLRLKMGTKSSDPLSSYISSNRNHHIHSQKLKTKSQNDTSSQIKITNVTSIAKNRKEPSVIVISDDENDDTPGSSDKESIVKMLNRAQKRPTTVSSVPSNVGSSKFQKLSDNFVGHASMRAYAASAPSILDSQRLECNCTSNNMCALHREILLRNRIGVDIRPLNGGNHAMNPLKSQDIVDLTQSNGVHMENFPKSAHNSHMADHQAAMKLNAAHHLHNSQIPELVQSNRNTVKEFIKSIQTPSEKIYNNGMKNILESATPFTIQHRPSIDPLCPLPPDYFQQQWMNMMMSSSQPFSTAESVFHQSSQFNQNNNSSVPPKNINPFINQSNAFYNC